MSGIAGLNPFQFSTQYTDSETGLVYYGYRYYNPNTGRWISRDPSGDVAFLFRRLQDDTSLDALTLWLESLKPEYGFVGNDGINNSDVLGLAYFAYRPLAGFPIKVVGLLSYGNIALAHEELFFEDGKDPSNLGFFDDGTVHSDSSGGYGAPGKHYCDSIMRQAAAKHMTNPPYNLLGKGGTKFNCQDWCSAVLSTYNALGGK